ncbi:MAG TPA: amidohydrolase [Firmicutes bacterium]|nr:amidohydrolase [Bacillota bacterium]
MVALRTILIRGGWVLPLSEGGKPLQDGMVKITGNKIATVGPWREPVKETEPYEVIDARNRLVMPGLVNTHTHAAMVLLRGVADDLPLMTWLKEKIWPLEDRLTAEHIYWGTRLAINEMLLSGTTTFADMYFFEEEARAVEETGIRAVLSRGLIGLEEQAEKNLEEAVTQAREWRGRAGNRITVMLGPHAPYTCPPAFLKEVVAAAKQYQLGIHIHLAETADELVEIGKEYGKRPVAYLAEQGLFTRPVLAAHAVWLDDGEISYLARQKVAIAHNPSSNMKLASGIAPVPKLLAAKIPVGLGTDGAASNNRLDIFTEMRTAALLHKVQTNDPTVIPAETALKMATIYGARALGLGDVTGSLEPGKSADLIMLDLKKSHLTPLHDPVSLVVYAARGSDVSDVMANGEWLVREGRLVRWEEEEVLGEATRCAQSLVKK